MPLHSPGPTYADRGWQVANDATALRHHPPAASAGRHPGVAAAESPGVWSTASLRERGPSTHPRRFWIMRNTCCNGNCRCCNGTTGCGVIHVEDGTPRVPYQKIPYPAFAPGIGRKCAAHRTIDGAVFIWFCQPSEREQVRRSGSGSCCRRLPGRAAPPPPVSSAWAGILLVQLMPMR